MASARFRSSSVFVAGKKVGQMNNVKYHYMSGDEPQFGDPGYAGHSDGAATSSLTCTQIIPVSGTDFDPHAAIKSKVYLDITVGVIAGKLHQVTMRCIDYEVTGETKNGTLTGVFNLAGGDPTFTGTT